MVCQEYLGESLQIIGDFINCDTMSCENLRCRLFFHRRREKEGLCRDKTSPQALPGNPLSATRGPSVLATPSTSQAQPRPILMARWLAPATRMLKPFRP